MPHVASPAPEDDPLGLGDFGGDMGSYAHTPASLVAPARGGFAGYPAKRRGNQQNVRLLVGIALGGGGLVVLLLAIMVTAALLRSRSPQEQPAEGPGGVAASPVETAAAASSASAGSASHAPPASSAPASAPAGTWTVSVDPPAKAIVWPEQSDLVIPVPPQSGRVLFPPTPSPLAVIGMSASGSDDVQLWNLVTKEKIGQLAEKVGSGNDCSLSPDGQYLAVKLTGGPHQSTLQLWSFQTGGVVKEIECDDGKLYLQAFDFAGPDRIVAQTFGATGTEFRKAMSVWSVPDGKQLHDIRLQNNIPRANLAVSPGGRYLAGIEGSDKLFVFDLQSGQIAGHLLIEQLLGSRAGSFRGMSFSPDGGLLGLVYSDTNSQIIMLDVATGRIAQTIGIAGKPPTASAYGGDAVEWLGPRGWCLFGGTIIDGKTHRVVWNLDLQITDRLTARRSLPGGWIAQIGPHARKSLRFVPAPWDQIEASLAALEEASPAYLRPGESVSLEITIENLRFGTPEETRSRLAEMFAERFRGDDITVADGQPVVLSITYSETQGETLQERQGIVGPATGRTVQATKAELNLKLALRDESRMFWSDQISYDPRSVTVIGKELTEANVRDSIFRQLLFSLSETAIPYFLPIDSSLVALPGVTKTAD